jgi:hypothetical protein
MECKSDEIEAKLPPKKVANFFSHMPTGVTHIYIKHEEKKRLQSPERKSYILPNRAEFLYL